MVRRAVIIANGDCPDTRVMRNLTDHADFVLAADGGFDHAVSMGILPHAVLGDFDSIQSEIPSTVERIEAPDQNATDLEKSVQLLIERGYDDITILAGTGQRLDHTFGTLGLIAKYGLKLVDNYGFAQCLKCPGEMVIDTSPGQTLSLLPCGIVEGLTTFGLKWELNKQAFVFGENDGTSNVATGAKVTIKADSGKLIVYVLNFVSQEGS